MKIFIPILFHSSQKVVPIMCKQIFVSLTISEIWVKLGFQNTLKPKSATLIFLASDYCANKCVNWFLWYRTRRSSCKHSNLNQPVLEFAGSTLQQFILNNASDTLLYIETYHIHIRQTFLILQGVPNCTQQWHAALILDKTVYKSCRQLHLYGWNFNYYTNCLKTNKK